MKKIIILTFIIISTLNINIQAKEKRTRGFIKKTTPLWNGTVGYSTTSDYADSRGPRLFSNTFSLSISTSALPYQIGLTASSGISFKTLGTSIYEADPQSNGFHASDTSISAHRSFQITNLTFGTHGLTTSISLTLPTSTTSRYEGYKFIPSIGLGLSSAFFSGKYNVSSSVSLTKVINTYEYSQITGLSTPNTMAIFSHNHGVKIGLGFSTGLGISFKYAKRSDGFSNTSFANFAYLSYSYKKFGLGLSYSGGDHTTNDKVELWYVDKTRRLLTLSASYTF